MIFGSSMAVTSNASVVVGAFLDCVLNKANISSNASLEEVNATTCSNGTVNQRASSARQKGNFASNPTTF